MRTISGMDSDNTADSARSSRGVHSLISLQSDRSSCNLSHAALTCTNLDFSSFNRLTCVCGILIGLRSDRERALCVCWASATQQSERSAVTLWWFATFPSCNRIYGISEEVSRGARAAVFRLDRYVQTHCQAWPRPLWWRVSRNQPGDGWVRNMLSAECNEKFSQEGVGIVFPWQLLKRFAQASVN